MIRSVIYQEAKIAEMSVCVEDQSIQNDHVVDWRDFRNKGCALRELSKRRGIQQKFH